MFSSTQRFYVDGPHLQVSFRVQSNLCWECPISLDCNSNVQCDPPTESINTGFKARSSQESHETHTSKGADRRRPTLMGTELYNTAQINKGYINSNINTQQC